MINSTLRAFVTLCLAGGAALAQEPAAPAEAPLADLKVPEGFKISVFAGDLAGARLMAASPDGVIYVARQSKGEVVALPDRNRDGRADQAEVVLSGLAVDGVDELLGSTVRRRARPPRGT